MRRVILTIAAGVLLVIGGTAMAGEYHSGASLVCSDCHTMHFSQSHGYQADGSGFYLPLGGSAPHTYLLRDDVNNLCLACHNSSPFAPDVLTTQTGSAIRQAGALHRVGATGSWQEASGHTLDLAGAVAPGGTFTTDVTEGLLCTDCHQPHGYGGPTANPYRNLSPFSGGGFHPSVTYEIALLGAQTNSVDVLIAGTANSYDVNDIFFEEPDATMSGYGAWCGTCHSDFHGDVGSAQIGGNTADGHFDRHPTAGVDIGAIGGGHSSLLVYSGCVEVGFPATVDCSGATKDLFVQAMSESGGWPQNGTANTAGLLASDLTPSCFSCHKAHGNQNAFGLIYMEETGTLSEEGTTTDPTPGMRALCKQCHAQGG